MDLKEIKELIALMKKNDLSEFKLESEGFKIELKKGGNFSQIVSAAPAPLAGYIPQTPPAAAPVAAPAKEEKLREITSPMVGTFYQSPSPEAEIFVQVGQEVTPDTVVCIIEAMKVMNEIKAEISGVIAEIVAENGNPVQFGQPLFKLK